MADKFLLFDLDHTLLDFDQAETKALVALFEHYHVADIPTLMTNYRQINRAMWRQLETGDIEKATLVNTRFQEAFATIGRQEDGKVLAQDYERYLAQQGQTYEGALELLADLQQNGYRLFAATNGIAAIQKGRLAASGLAPYFEQVFISEEIGAAKPSPLFFEKIAEAIVDYQVDQAVMIGDSLTADIPGGKQAGLKTIWVNLSGKALNGELLPDYEVQNYEQLKALFCNVQLTFIKSMTIL